MLLPFTKMHGLGNDFIVLDTISHPVSLSPEQIRQLADRHFGIGFDQLLLVEPPSLPDVDFDYRIYNSDGGEVEHCGNGARCFARFVLDRGLIARTPIRVKTVNGILELQVQPDGLVTVDMGAPNFAPESLPFNANAVCVNPVHANTVHASSGNSLAGAEHRVTIDIAGHTQEVAFRVVSVGNPHAVIVVDNVDMAPVHEIGAILGKHAAFPRGVNVGFMQIVDRKTIRLRVFERGAGETLACGTGACAAVVTGIAGGLLDKQVKSVLRGGELRISWAGNSHPILMQGPANTVYEGSVTL